MTLKLHKARADALIAKLPGPRSSKWPEGERFIAAFSRGSMSVELYAPQRVDPQTPHTQDELYIVHRGSGEYVYAGACTLCAAGDVLFAAAGVTHRFEKFSPDFAVWVIFYGPPGGEPE